MYETIEQWHPIFGAASSYPPINNTTEQIKHQYHTVIIEELDEDESKELVPFYPNYNITLSSEDDDNAYSNKSNTHFIKELESEEESFSDQYEESVVTFDMERYSDIVFNIPENEKCDTCGYDIFQICTTNLDVFNKFIKSDTLYQRFLFNFVKNVLKSLNNGFF